MIILRTSGLQGMGVIPGHRYLEITCYKNGLNFHEYPTSGIHVFEKDPSSVGPGDFLWRPVNNLGTHSLFLGLNYPMNVKIYSGEIPDGTLIPFLRQNCVYTSYDAFRVTPFPQIRRCNLHAKKGEVAGAISLVQHGWENF